MITDEADHHSFADVQNRKTNTLGNPTQPERSLGSSYVPRPNPSRRPPIKQTASEVGSLPDRLRQHNLDDGNDRSAYLHGQSPPQIKWSQKRSMDSHDAVQTADDRPYKKHNADPARQFQESNSRRTSVSGHRSSTRSPPVQSHALPSSQPLTQYVLPATDHAVAAPSAKVVESAVVPDAAPESETTLLKQPATRAISEQQLINEVKGIYAGLVMVEKKCVEIVAQQSISTKGLEPQQWKALVALHRTLLQEHHDFFSASQHPTASEPLKRLAVKYAMPARMWRHGIHAFLELLRHRLPDSMEHMLSFIYLSYSMMALLKESVPAFVETWIECLGDLARYRMAIEDSDPKDREIWSNVARTWYNEAADKSPNVGRIQHHLAVLARPNIVEQLFYYTKALTSHVPFVNARESIMLLFDMFLKNNEAMQTRYPTAEASLVYASALLFTRGSKVEFYVQSEQFANNLSIHMDRTGPKLKVQGPQMALALFAGVNDYGKEDSQVWTMGREYLEKAETDVYKGRQHDEFTTLGASMKESTIPAPYLPPSDGPMTSGDILPLAGKLLWTAIFVMSSKIGDKNIVPFFHAVLACLWGMSFQTGVLPAIESYVPWMKLADFLNTVGRSGVNHSNIESEVFPPSFGGSGRQLPEDFYLRGYGATMFYYPAEFFTQQLVDEDERSVELPSHQAPRAERCLWLGVRIATLGRYLTYDAQSRQFGVTSYATQATKI